MRQGLALVVLALFSGCAGLLHAPAEGRPQGQSVETVLLDGMNPDFLAPGVRQVQVEVDWIEGWKPGEVALQALQAEIRQWAPTGTDVSVRVDSPISRLDWSAAEDTFGHTAALVRANGDPTGGEEHVTQLHVAYVPTLRPFGMRGALGVTLPLPHGTGADEMRMSLVLGTEQIQKIAALWIGPRKVERTVLVHELGHALGLVSDGAHQHRGDPSHCRNSSCLMVSSGNKAAMVVGAPRAIFLGRLPTKFCSVCRGDLESARHLFAASEQDPVAWAKLVAERRAADRDQWIAFLLQSGDIERAVTELQSPEHAPSLEGLWTLSRTLRGLGRWEEALGAGRRLEALDPQGRSVQCRAGPLLDMGRWEEALQEIEQAKTLGTYEWRLEAQALLGAGRAQEADDRIRLMAEQQVNNPGMSTWLLRHRLWLWRAAGDPARAAGLLADVPPRDLRADPALAVEAGRALLAGGSTEQARKLLDPLAREKKAKSRWHVALVAQARALTGDAAGARRAVDAWSEWFYPGEQSLLRGEILATLERTEEALDALEEARRQGGSPEVPCLNPDLAVLRNTDRFQALYQCRRPTQASPNTGLPEAEDLTARVARSPVTRTEFGPQFIIGAKVGNELLTSTALSDPDGRETFDIYFDDWVATARARLLLDYARAKLREERPPDYSTWSATQASEQRTRDAADAARITAIAQEGNYSRSWAPFVAAYASFRTDALHELPDEPPTPELAQKVTQIAEKHGLIRMMAELPIEPRHVAAEMLRLVNDFRAWSGGPDGKLLYACDGDVRVHVDDPLGPALLEALTRHPMEPIAVTFGQLKEDFSAWSKGHPQADQREQDAYLHRTAEDIGLMRLLAEADTAGAGDRPPAVP